MIRDGDYQDVIENPARVVLKTAYPSREYHRIYGDEYER